MPFILRRFFNHKEGLGALWTYLARKSKAVDASLLMFYLRKQLTFCDATAGFDDRGTSAEISSDDATVPGSGMGSVSDWLKLAIESTVISMEIQVCARRNQWWRREKSDFFHRLPIPYLFE